MRVPFDWLAEKFATPLDRTRIAEALFESGFELEALDWVRPGLETVVTGRILSAEMHPNADRLRICMVDIGGATSPSRTDASGPLQIVTAAPNVQKGDIVPVALVGSSLPTGKEIALGKLRGVESFGMFCSATELGMSLDNPDDARCLEALEVKKAAARGIELDAASRAKAREAAFEYVLVLPEGTPLGQGIATVLELGDCVLEVAITANRGDALSVAGLARALSAAGLGELTSMPTEAPADQAAAPVRVTLADPDLCPRYAAQVVEGIAIGPSPAWLTRRLELAGIRSLNNAVDVMNYIMLDVGQPLHAFDLAKIDAMAIEARRARPGERIHTLDDVERVLSADTLVIADSSGPLAIAGVMGGLPSAVTSATTGVLIESAYFKPSSIRLTARALGLSSESSYRFERGVDPEATVAALRQAANLLVKVAGGHLRGPALDVRHEGFPEALVVPLRPDRTTKVLGHPIVASEQLSLLAKLGLNDVTGQHDYSQAIEAALLQEGKRKFGQPALYQDARWLLVPGWRRHDITREIDLIEEIARLYGYSRLPATLPALDRLPAAGVKVVDQLRELLRGFGFWEVLTNSIVSPASQQGFVQDPSRLVTLANPLGDMQVMRISLIPSLLEVARTNLHNGSERLMVFDAGRVYTEGPEGRSERLLVAALALGAVGEGMWKHPPEALTADFFWAKGIAQNTLAALGLGAREALAAPEIAGLHPGRAARFEKAGHTLASFGEIHPLLAERFDLGDRAATCIVVFDPEAIAHALAQRPAHRFAPYSKFPASERDQALVVDRSLKAGALLETARQTGGLLLESAQVFDRYEGAQIPEGKVSLALRLRYRAPDRTLTDGEVEALHKRIVGALIANHAAVVRA